MDVIQYGLGPIGVKILDLAAKSTTLNVQGAVDIDPSLVGQDIGTLLGSGDTGVRVVETLGDLSAGLPSESGATAFHAAGSRLEKVWPQLRDILHAGFSIVSTCEELAYPWSRHPRLAKEIDQLARERGLTVLGTGVNPGFVMDTLALCMTAAFADVRSVRVTRTVDVSARRLQLQRKVGVGLDRDDFERLAGIGEIGHVGLEESARLVAHGLGWDLVDVVNTIKPTLATSRHQVALDELAPGDVDGQDQSCVARTADERAIELRLIMRVAADQQDEIVIAGDNERRLIIPGGVPGDTATAAVAVNCAKRMNAMDAGLVTMAEAGLPHAGP